MDILVVDDSRSARQAIVSALQGLGYPGSDVVEAASSEEALEVLGENAEGVDLVLLDWIMPGMSGLDLLRKMKATKGLARVPVVLITGIAQRDRVVQAMQEGASGVILKPFQVETLRAKILEIRQGAAGAPKLSSAAAMRQALARATKPDEGKAPFWAQLPADLQAAIQAAGQTRVVAPGRTLIRFTDVVEALHIVAEGEVEILAAAGDKALEVRRSGECIAESAFLSGDSAALIARARSTSTILSLDRVGFDRLLAAHPVLGIHMMTLIARQMERDKARLWSRMSDGLSGHLGMMSMGDLVQTLHSGAKTGLLRFTHPGESGEAYFHEGEVKHVRCGGRVGEEAFYDLLGKSEGSFVFSVGAREFPPEELPGTMYLLMEGARQLDEKRKRGETAAAGG